MARGCGAVHRVHRSRQRPLPDRERRADVRDGSCGAQTRARDVFEAIDDLPIAPCRQHGEGPQYRLVPTILQSGTSARQVLLGRYPPSMDARTP